MSSNDGEQPDVPHDQHQPLSLRSLATALDDENARSEDCRRPEWAPIIEKAPAHFKSMKELAIAQRINVLQRKRSALQEVLLIAGTNGDCYEVYIDWLPWCTCDYPRRLFPCKHIIHAMLCVLRAPENLAYQRFLTERELRTIFEDAGPVPAKETNGQYNGRHKPIRGDCCICKMPLKIGALEEGASEDDFDNRHERLYYRRDFRRIVYCRWGCGENFHEPCREEWCSKHELEDLTCPSCGTPWSYRTSCNSAKWYTTVKYALECALFEKSLTGHYGNVTKLLRIENLASWERDRSGSVVMDPSELSERGDLGLDFSALNVSGGLDVFYDSDDEEDSRSPQEVYDPDGINHLLPGGLDSFAGPAFELTYRELLAIDRRNAKDLLHQQILHQNDGHFNHRSLPSWNYAPTRQIALTTDFAVTARVLLVPERIERITIDRSKIDVNDQRTWTVTIGPNVECSGISCQTQVATTGNYRGYVCEHILYVMLVVLRAPDEIAWRKVLPPSELRELLAPRNWARSAEESECSICLTEFDDARLVRCGATCHKPYHQDCLEEWLIESRSCPHCRAPWVEQNEVTLDDLNSSFLEDWLIKRGVRD